MNFIDLTRGKYPHLYVPSWRYDYNFKNVISICHDFQDLFSVNGKRVDVEDILQTIPIFLVESSMSGEYFPVPGAECLIKVPLDITYGLVGDFDIDEWVNSKEDGHKDDLRERRSVRSEIFDILGVYVSMEEGTLIPRRIFVWMDKIQEYAERNTDKRTARFKGDVNDNASALFDLVVCHELAHALMDVELYGVRPSPNFTYAGDYVYRFIEEAYANAVALKVLYDAFGEVQKRFVEKFVENQGPGYSEGLELKNHIRNKGLWIGTPRPTFKMWMGIKVLFNYDMALLLREFWKNKSFSILHCVESVCRSGFLSVKNYKSKWRIVELPRQDVIGGNLGYDAIHFFDENDLCVVVDDGKFGCIDLQGDVKIPLVYEDLRSLGMNRYCAKKSNLYGSIDASNNVIIDFLYENEEEIERVEQ